MELSGCFTAITTPFTADGLDEAAMAAHAEWMVNCGVAGIVVVGTTGESATMTNDEKIRAMQVVSEAVGSRATVVGGAGNNCTQESLDFVDRVNRETGVDAIMSVVPYYTKPPQAGMLLHFRAIAEKSRFPVIVYNVPSRTGDGTGMTVATMAGLTEHPNIIGVKEASGKIHDAAKLAEAAAPGSALFSGDDGTSMAFLAVGGHGVISVASNIAPRQMSAMCRAVREGDMVAARKHNHVAIRLQDLLFNLPNPIPVKVGVANLGFGTPRVRAPLCEMPAEIATELLAEFETLGLRR